MAAPTSYSETSFKQYLLYAIGAVATSLGWTVSTNQVAEALNETLLCYGEDDIAAITGAANLLKLRTLGRREIWRAVCAEVSGDYNIENEAGKMDRSQQYSMAQRMLAQAISEALIYDAAYNVERETVTYNDPYLPTKLTEDTF
jgi:hypothetical protein